VTHFSNSPAVGMSRGSPYASILNSADDIAASVRMDDETYGCEMTDGWMESFISSQHPLLYMMQINLVYLFKPHQFDDVTIHAIPSLNFFIIIRFQICAIPLTQLAKNIYKLINHHIALIKECAPIR